MPDILTAALAGLHYACACGPPAVALLTTIITINSGSSTGTRARRWASFSLSAQILTIATYILEIIAVVLLDNDAFGTHNGHLAHLLLAALTWTTVSGFSNTNPVLCTATSGILVSLELPITVLFGIQSRWRTFETSAFVAQLVRIISLLLIIAIFTRQTHLSASASDDDTQSLLHDQEGAVVDYGGVPTSSKLNKVAESVDEGSDEECGEDEDEPEDAAAIRKRRAELLKEKGGWLGYLKDFKIFAPYIIPKNDRKVQLCYLACIGCLLGGRALAVMIPTQLGKVADNLANKEPPYQALATWLLLQLARYYPGMECIEQVIKIPIENFSYRELTNAAFRHVMSLSMDFHSERDSAEVIKAIEQGNAITSLLSTLVLTLIPAFLDLGIAVVYLSQKFNQYVAIALLAATVAFTAAEVVATSWNLENRRTMAKAGRQEAKITLQAVQGWQTVSFFNRFGFERQRFGQAVQTHLAAKQKWGVGDAMVQGVVEALFPSTFFVLACLVIHEIHSGRATAGDFVFLMQYWENLTWPISMLTHNCRFLMSDLVDAERLLHLFQTKPTVKDNDGAVNLYVEGRVEFQDVHFGYSSGQTTIRDLTFIALPGQTIALVGETGAGKSSIMKLLLRLYDVIAGCVKIDGHDIRGITLDSLRTAIGVVPQAPLLFNGTILENLRYAKLDATDVEIQEACRAAAIHDKIMSFKEGYQTKVGEHGVKLSGGEVQRLAIARVFLKDPPILILDEATSAVDSLTEAAVQTALERVRNGRTTLVIAHRLSTIVRADQILVIHDGVIEEQGRHSELLHRGGRYHRMWTSQTNTGGT